MCLPFGGACGCPPLRFAGADEGLVGAPFFLWAGAEAGRSGIVVVSIVIGFSAKLTVLGAASSFCCFALFELSDRFAGALAGRRL